VVLGRVEKRVEDYKLPSEVMRKIVEARKEAEKEL
jgi:hypothetical protein